ncbi:dnaJ homolog subfamily C member 1, partial [Neolamprologus brichardi]|uniref:dnaJ homolog subfamily C member 1 n=1 Tax=Neolamprologus brichardi TaxID=32507 RepID=UPI001643B151
PLTSVSLQEAPGAEIKKAYRRLSLILHPDKNKDENAETQFRQLVAIYEVLKDEERRRKYDDILLNGLPDWRQPVFYYRRVRKMSNVELGFLLFVILTVGHYAVIWSIYLEKQLDELLSKKKKEKKKKLNSKPAEELRCVSQERADRYGVTSSPVEFLCVCVSDVCVCVWAQNVVINIKQFMRACSCDSEVPVDAGTQPTSCYTPSRSGPGSGSDPVSLLQEVKQYYEDYQQMKQEQREAEAEQEVAPREKRPKVKKPKVEFPVYEPSAENHTQSYDPTTSIEDIEEQMDDWLQDRRAPKKKAADWTEDELSLLSRLMVKFPGGTPGRWEKIAHELGRSVSDVTAKVKQMKDSVSHTSGLVKLSELKAPPLPVKSHNVDDSMMTQREGEACEEEQEEEVEAPTVRRRNRKCSDGGEAKVRGRRQRDFDPAAVDEEEAEPQPEPTVWTQNQQKLLELALQQFPRGTPERWDRIAKVVPGKSKEECMIRYKILAELIQKRKQAKS